MAFVQARLPPSRLPVDKRCGKCGDRWGLQFEMRAVLAEQVVHRYRCWCGEVQERVYPRNLNRLRAARQVKQAKQGRRRP